MENNSHDNNTDDKEKNQYHMSTKLIKPISRNIKIFLDRPSLSAKF